MNKRGFRLIAEETLRIIIAVLCIIGLVLLAVDIYNTFVTTNTDLNHAKDTLTKLVNAINSGDTRFEITQPYHPTSDVNNIWMVLSYPQMVPVGTTIMPKQCKFSGWDSCLCICKIDTSESKGGCDNVGTCQESSFTVAGQNHNFVIAKYPTVVVIDQKNKLLSADFSQ
jgi:hypothetical protein